MSKNDRYKRENLLDYLYLQNYDKLFRAVLSSQTNTSISKKIGFVEKLEEDGVATIFLSLKNSKKTILNIFSDSLNET